MGIGTEFGLYDYAYSMIKTYVPEAEYLSFIEAYVLALDRDRNEAENLRWSVLDD